jgi:hypothetical protein
MQGNVDSRSEVADHLFAIERDEALAAIWKLHRQKAAMETETVTGKVCIYIDFEDLYLQHITRFCLFDGDGWRRGQ